ncbi:uncharacterized protein [Maniola hyperantus]|uniref:uncharacterized protein n=1 Tax=Aphantopus hyperantus TaxID=2795564 RepID=UPI001568A80F|nr:uncharacterized protein LOC117986711 [Maniola hyperantus]
MFTRPAVTCILLLSAVYATDTKTSGISQFWTDDYKVFDQIYGKTSDKELYGALPAGITYGLDFKKPIAIEASEKRERYLTNGKDLLEFDPQAYDASDRYAKLFAKSLYSEKTKPSSALQFISFSDIKPISQTTDPETYNYLKHLEHSSKEKYVIPKKLKTNFKSYTDVDSESEAEEAYKSIQDILDAHEANKGTVSSDDEDFNVRPKGKKTADESEGSKYTRSRNRSKVRFLSGNSIKSRCVTGRCRTPAVRVSSRPYIRKIKHYTYSRR